MKAHLLRSKAEDTHQARWLRKLAACGKRPQLEPIAEVLVDEWAAWEKHFIKYFRSCGFDLTNTAEGGNAPPRMLGPDNPMFGKPLTPEHKEKLSIAHIGKPMHPNTAAALRRANTGRAMPEEQRNFLSRLKTGRPMPAEWVETRIGVKFKNCSSGYKGVSKYYNKWMAYYKPRGGAQKNLGYYVDEIDAARARDVFVRLRGLDSRLLNFPNE